MYNVLRGQGLHTYPYIQIPVRCSLGFCLKLRGVMACATIHPSRWNTMKSMISMMSMNSIIRFLDCFFRVTCEVVNNLPDFQTLSLIGYGQGCHRFKTAILKPSAAPQEPSTMKKDRQQTDQTGRTASGRFAAGNSGGPGNPFARRIAGLRSTMLDCITGEDIQAVVAMLVNQAKTGDLAAAKLLLSYVIGQPDKQADPDSLDTHEFQTVRARPSRMDLVLLAAND